MNAIIDAALTHSRTILTAFVLLLISGTLSYIQIPKEADPDISIPIIYVTMSHEGISPEDAERLLIRPMEQKLRSIEGVKEMKGTGYEGGGNVLLEFDAGFDVDQALDDVREKVDLAKPDLPSDTDEPEVHEVNLSQFPVITVTLAGELPERTLLKLGRHLRDSIEGIASVLEVKIAGDREEQVEILIDPVKVESYGLSPADAINAVRSSNLLIAAGAQDTGKGRFALKVPGLFETEMDIYRTPIKVDGDSVVMLGDITEIRRGFKDRESYARINGRNAIALEVSKRSGENIIDTIASIRNLVASERQNWPEALQNGVDIAFANDKSNDIKTMLGDLQNNVIAAILLVLIVVISALGLRTAGLVGISIPGSFLTGILLLSVMGYTINIVVLFALILAVGMLVDGAIVVTEYADRKMIEGEPRNVAYGLAAKRMSWPIIASTATTLAAFLPLMFWPGVVGEFMKYLPLTLIFTLSASLMMALVFVPTLGSVIGKPGGTVDTETMQALAAEEGGHIHGVHGFTGLYLKLLDKAISHPAKVLLVALMVLVGVQYSYAMYGKGVEFFPDVEPDFAKLQVKARGNLSVDEKDNLMREVEQRILDINNKHHEFDVIYTKSGGGGLSEDSEDTIGSITLELTDWQTRRKADQILDEIKQRVSDISGIYVDRRKQESGPPVGKAVQVQLLSHNPRLLDPAIEKLRAAFDEIGGFDNIEDSRPLPGIDWRISVDRPQAAKFGADVSLIGNAVMMASGGLRLGGYRPDDSEDELDIRVRYPKPYRNIHQLDQIRVATAAGMVPLSNFVTITPVSRTGKINRVDGLRVMEVKSDVVEGILPNDQVKKVVAWLKTADLDPDIKVTFKGEDEEQKLAEQFLVKAFGVALFIMAVILVTQFNSFYSALLVLTAVIMSTIGVFIGLLVTEQPFGIVMGGIGVIALAGIVVNNNIVLIDTFDRLKETEQNVRDAILKTGAQRLRPVLLTTITTMLGLMPMVLGVNIDFVNRAVSIGAPAMQWWGQLSTAIVFGLGFATILTLVVTPSALMLRGNVSRWLQSRRSTA